MNHGTGGYSQGCRCDTCRDAMNAYTDRPPAAPARLLDADGVVIPGVMYKVGDDRYEAQAKASETP